MYGRKKNGSWRRSRVDNPVSSVRIRGGERFRGKRTIGDVYNNACNVSR